MLLPVTSMVLLSQLLRNTRQKAEGRGLLWKRTVFLSWVTSGTPLVGGSYLAPSLGDFQEAVGELVEGQAPHPVGMLKLLHLIRVESQRT
jgi:hypothetical protein